MDARFKIGQKFIRLGDKNKRVETIVDIHKTYNHLGDLVQIRYVTEYLFCGQLVQDRNTVDATIARAEKLEVCNDFA